MEHVIFSISFSDMSSTWPSSSDKRPSTSDDRRRKAGGSPSDMDITTTHGKQSTVHDKRRKASDSPPDTQHIRKVQEKVRYAIDWKVPVYPARMMVASMQKTTAAGQTRESQADTDGTIGESTDVSYNDDASRAGTSITCKFLS